MLICKYFVYKEPKEQNKSQFNCFSSLNRFSFFIQLQRITNYQRIEQ